MRLPRADTTLVPTKYRIYSKYDAQLFIQRFVTIEGYEIIIDLKSYYLYKEPLKLLNRNVFFLVYPNGILKYFRCNGEIVDWVFYHRKAIHENFRVRKYPKRKKGRLRNDRNSNR